MAINKKQRFFWILLVLASIITILILNHLITIFHEFGHKNEAEKQGINLQVNLKLPTFSKNFQLGSANFLTKQDCENFNNLPLKSRVNILLVGIKVDIIVSYVLLLISFALLSSAYLTLKNLKNKRTPLLLLVIGVIIFTLALLNLYGILENLKDILGRDFYYIFNNFPCG